MTAQIIPFPNPIKKEDSPSDVRVRALVNELCRIMLDPRTDEEMDLAELLLKRPVG